jgi:hypothetical protein
MTLHQTFGGVLLQHVSIGVVLVLVADGALVAKVRDGGSVRNKAVNIAVGIDLDGEKHVLGIWVAAAEGSRVWAQALPEMAGPGGVASRRSGTYVPASCRAVP